MAKQNCIHKIIAIQRQMWILSSGKLGKLQVTYIFLEFLPKELNHPARSGDYENHE